ncbi:metacaspase-1 isoform X2 [Momordica charantia]|uniref:Metacaspase-1 isoform X2 n=1 Tax=Momordica charantia TaxID=3673 RepID=A0A6J1CL65_MOMCH|nr:metacaspase-1 isoform X2 [Momordica charantia]
MDTKSATCNCKKDHRTITTGFKCKCFKFKPSSSDAGALRTRRNMDRDGDSRAEITLRPPLPPTERLSSASSDGRPRKRALLCGVTYKNWKHKLHGTVNDVLNMQELLINDFAYPKQNIRILTEEETDPDRIPTKKNIQSSLKWLVEGCEGGENLVFYFSGHGLRQPDFAMDELDGYDETICPVDFLEEGMISDNEINATIVWPLKNGVKLHAIVDACHSGTILDLPYVYSQRNGWIDNRPPSGARKETSGGLAISLSACGDDQYAADTSMLTGKTMNGAMTFILIDLVKNFKNLTYECLLEYMHDAVERANRTGCIGYFLFKKLFRYKQIQEPQLSSSERFDVSKKIFTL